MAVSLEALAMAGADSDCRDYCLTIEEWERKYILKPAPHLLSPKLARREKISCKNYPLFLFFPKKRGKIYDCSREGEEEEEEAVEEEKKWSDYEENESPGRRKRKKGSMAKGFREFGDMLKRISCNIVRFFSGAIKKKKSKFLC